MWFILNREMVAVGVLDNKLFDGLPILEDTLIERLDKGYNNLIFTIPSNHEKTGLIETEGFIVHIKKSRNTNELFRIKEIDESHGDSMTKVIYCEPSATSDLLSQIIRPKSYIQQSLASIARDLLANTGWELGDTFYDDLVTITIDDYPTALEAIYRVIESFDAEIEFLVEFSNQNVTRKLVNFYDKRGLKTSEIFEYSKNLRGVKRREDSNRIFTSLIAVGNEVDEVKLTLEKATATVPEGFQIAGDAVIDLDATEKWGNNGRALEGLFVDALATTHNELFKNTLAELKKVNTPLITYEVDVALIGVNAEIGDTILVKDTTFNPPLYLQARVLEKTSSETDPEKGAVILGEYVALKVSSLKSIEQLQKKIALEEDGWNLAREKAEQAIGIADGVKDAIDNIGDAISYKVEVHSSNGYAFKTGVISTNLYCVVYKGKDDLTSTLPVSAFIWKKYDKNGNADVTWNNAHKNVGKTITLTGADVYEKATFYCDVDIA